MTNIRQKPTSFKNNAYYHFDLVKSMSVSAHELQYIPRNMHTVFALLCFVVVIHWLVSPYPSGLLHWHCGNLTIAPVPAKQPWWIWINTSCEFIIDDCITTTKQSTTKPCAFFLGYTVHTSNVEVLQDTKFAVLCHFLGSRQSFSVALIRLLSSRKIAITLAPRVTGNIVLKGYPL